MGIRELQPSETAAALQLAWEVFSQFEAAVSSSPYAVAAYRRFGFVPTHAEQTQNRIHYTSMRDIVVKGKEFII